MAQPRAEQLTLDNRIVNTVETSIVDLIAVNSGTCTGNFDINNITANQVLGTGKISADHLVANSGTLAVRLISPIVQANSGIFLTSLTVSGIPVSLGGGSGITALVQDPTPTLGGNLNGNSNSISGVNALTANTGNFPVSTTTATLNANSASVAFTTTSDHFVGNSGTLNGKLIAETAQANSGVFSSSLTISGVSVPLVPAHRIYYFIAGAATASTNTPATPRFYNNSPSYVQRVDFSGCKEVRFETVQIAAGIAGCRFACNGKTGSFSTTVGDYTTISTAGVNGNLSIDGNSANSYKDSGWLTLLPEFRNECFLAVVTSGGNGSIDPSTSQMRVSAR